MQPSFYLKYRRKDDDTFDTGPLKATILTFAVCAMIYGASISIALAM